MMVHFRKRFGQKALDKIKSNIIDGALSHQSASNKKDDDQEPP